MVTKGDKARRTTGAIAVALETVTTRAFASALEWPGWTRSGRDGNSALEALLAYGPRYQRAISSARLGFRAPKDAGAFDVTQRLEGDSTTAFGAPSIPASLEGRPVDGEELKHIVRILYACWDYFERAAREAEGKPLRKGPRGGGRDVQRIVDHVIDGHNGYLRTIYWRERPEKRGDFAAIVAAAKEADGRALAFAISDEMPERGPRGGTLWKPRYFARRSAWHVLDHAWEIEDRIEG